MQIKVGVVLLFGSSTVTDDLHMDGLLASSDLSVRPSSPSPTMDMMLFCPLSVIRPGRAPKGSVLHFPKTAQ